MAAPHRESSMRAAAPASITFLSVVPQFTVPDLVRTVAYYRDVLGFDVMGYWDGTHVTAAPTDPVFAIVKRGQTQVFFNRGDGSEVRSGRSEERRVGKECRSR